MQFFRKGRRESVIIPDKPGTKVRTRFYLAFTTCIIAILVLVVYAFTTVYPTHIFSAGDNAAAPAPRALLIDSHPRLPDSPLKTSSEKLIAGMDDVWAGLFKRMGKTYVKPKVQLFTDTITAESCGYGEPVTGSFYCSEGKIIYIDLSVLQDLEKKHPSIVKLAQAYVIGHQAGHHVQDLLGTLSVAEAAYSQQADNRELQADYYAGVWAHYAWKNEKPLDDIDLELAISLVNQMSLDRMAKPGSNMPDAYSHLNPSERARWFSNGYRSGDPKKPGDSKLPVVQ